MSNPSQSAAAGALLEAHGVTKVYPGAGVAALDGVDLVVRPGEWVALVGPSGSGKSTLLHLFAGLDVPTSGSVQVDGRDLSALRHLARYRRLEVGLVFQLHNLLAHLDARHNVEIAMFGDGRSRKEQRRRAGELLELVGLGAEAARKPPELSGGERQRVAIARALANDPRVLLADEPTGSLDPDNVAVVQALFSGLREQGKTILMVTHDTDVAASASRSLELRSGRIVGAPSGLPVPVAT